MQISREYPSNFLLFLVNFFIRQNSLQMATFPGNDISKFPIFSSHAYYMYISQIFVSTSDQQTYQKICLMYLRHTPSQHQGNAKSCPQILDSSIPIISCPRTYRLQQCMNDVLCKGKMMRFKSVLDFRGFCMHKCM